MHVQRKDGSAFFQQARRSVRNFIAHMAYNSHTHKIFHQSNILKLKDIYNLYLGKYMYLQINNMHPAPLLRWQLLCKDIHSYNTRQANLLHKENRRTAFVANSFVHKGTDYWNTLPETIKNKLTVISFNIHHKSYLLNAYNFE